MGVGVSGMDVSLIQLQGPIEQFLRDSMPFRQLLEKISHRMSPCLCSHPLKDRLDGLFSSLLSGEAGPVVETTLQII